MNEVLTGEVLPPEAPPLMQLDIQVVHGATILTLIDAADVPMELRDYLLVRVNDTVVFDWAHVFIRDGDRVEFLALPSGGGGGGAKQIISSIAMLAVTLVAGPLAGALLPTAGAFTLAATTAGISLVGALLIRALIPPPTFNGAGAGTTTAPTAESPSYAFTGQSNEIRLYQRVPRIYGRTRFAPPLAATPQIVNIGKSSKVSVLYDFGIGDINVTDMRSGNLDIETLDPEIRIYRNTINPDLDFITRGVAYDQLDYAMEQNEPVLLQTNPESIGAVVDINFPTGLVRFDRNGERRMNSVGVRIRYRLTGTSTWTTLPVSKYSGANKNQEALRYESYYEVGDLEDGRDVTSAWIVWGDIGNDAGKYEIHIVWEGRFLYNKREDAAYDRIQTVTTGGRTFARGALRETHTDGNGDGNPRTAYELLVGFPIEGNAVVLNNNTAEPFVVSAALSFPTPGVYEIEVTRTTPVSDPTLTNSIRDESRIGMIKSWKRGKVLNLRKRHTLVEMRYTATDKVSGVIQNFNAIATASIRDFDANGFNGYTVTQGNNALIAIDLLTGEGSKYPLTASQIDWPSWARLRNICAQWRETTVNGVTTRTRRYRWNGVLQQDATVKEAVGAVLSNCRAALILTTAGKWGVLIDEADNTPRQLITPINSWGFSGSRPFIRMPDALRVAFVNEDSDWSAADVLVYRDGKNASNSNVIEDVPTTGITSYPEAWRYGRYMLAQGIVRSETFTVNMDVENLAVQRGDKVLVQHDVPLHGGQAFRVMAVNTATSEITIDSPAEIYTGLYTARRTSGAIASGKITGQTDESTLKVDKISNFNVDTLVVIDITTQPTEEYIVQAIEPMDDLAAKLTLIKYDNRIYTADTGALPDWDPGFGDDIHGKTRVRIDWQSVSWSWTYLDRVPHLKLIVDWKIIAGQPTYGGAIYEVSTGNDPWTPIYTVPDSETRYVHYIRWDEDRYFDGALRLRVTPFNVIGIRGTPIRQDVRLPAYSATPEPPTNFSADVRSQEISLSWQPSVSLDVTDYVLRYSPRVEGATWSTAQYLAKVNAGHLAFTTGARTGTYFIVAENVIGKQSRPVSTRTTIERLPDINIMYQYDPAPEWSGKLQGFTKGLPSAYSYTDVGMLDGHLTKIAVPVGWSDTLLRKDGTEYPILTDVDISTDTLVSHRDWGRRADNEDRAVFTYSRIFDLTAIFECRIQSLIEATAVNAGVFNTVMETAAQYATAPQYQVSASAIVQAMNVADMAAITVSNTPMALGEQSPAGPSIYQSPFLTAVDAPTDLTEHASDWDCWLEYRAIDEMDVIANWDPLSSVTNMSLGTSEWGPWRPIKIGDATGRAFQFRIVGEAEDQGTVIMVTSGAIELDMPDRTWRTSNIAVPAAGVTVNFDPAFAAPPIIAVTIEGSTTAVSYKATNLTRTAVRIQLFNAAGTAVSGQIDLAALGYGRERAKGI